MIAPRLASLRPASLSCAPLARIALGLCVIAFGLLFWFVAWFFSHLWIDLEFRP